MVVNRWTREILPQGMITSVVLLLQQMEGRLLRISVNLAWWMTGSYSRPYYRPLRPYRSASMDRRWDPLLEEPSDLGTEIRIR
jgi:hypothetical protein